MSTITNKLQALGIKLGRWTPGNHKTLCPKCSHTRKKRIDPCLSVTIETSKALIHCFNCGWATAIFEGDNDGKTFGRGARMGRRAGHQRIDLGATGRRQRYNGYAS